ncbi:MAG: heavy metal translocating P-type ATPase [Candidatus Lokiarchaeota archaeon]|nr:heavy metal translocating P-type ATPase [Candidatus Lokiarchaeota archaeon]
MKKKFEKAVVLIIEITLLVLNITLYNVLSDSPNSWLGNWANIFGFISFLIGGVKVIIESIINLMHKDFTADILFSIALTASVIIGLHLTAATLILMMGIGDLLEEWTIEKAHGNIKQMLNLLPDNALIKADREQKFVEKSIQEIRLGDKVLVKEGTRIPVDGLVIDGEALVNQSSVTGESIPSLKQKEDQVYAGTLVEEGFIIFCAKSICQDSSLEKVVQLVESAQKEKSNFQEITDKWAQYFTPFIIFIALFVWIGTNNILYTMSVLLVSCPCSLLISVPTAFIAAIANSAKNGLWIKSGKIVEKLGRVNMIFLDKTGTLTSGILSVASIYSSKPRKDIEKTILRLAASAEMMANHPIAKAIITRSKLQNIKPIKPISLKSLKGKGIHAEIMLEGKQNNILVGNALLLKNLDKELIVENEHVVNRIYVVQNNEVLGHISLRDELKSSARKMVEGLKEIGLRDVIMLTGDKKEIAEYIANELGIEVYKSQMLPEDKLAVVKESMEIGAIPLFIGDGINDAPSIALSSVGVAIGQGGTDIAVDVADVILLSSNLEKIVYAIKLGKKTLKKAKINILIAIIMNFVGILLSIFGILTPIFASAWHVIQSLIVVLNASLILRFKI